MSKTNTELKQKFLEYFKQLPVQKLAAAHIGKDEDTITRWKKEDGDFADQIEQAKAEWALKNVKDVKSKEWLLERLMKDHFSQRTELTGKEGEPLHGELTDKQLDERIKAKLKQIGVDGIATGEGKENA